MGRKCKLRTYVIDVKRLDPRSLEELGGRSSALASSVLLDVLGR